MNQPTREGQQIIIANERLTVGQAEAFAEHVLRLCKQARREYGRLRGVCRSKWSGVRVERWTNEPAKK